MITIIKLKLINYDQMNKMCVCIKFNNSFLNFIQYDYMP